MAPAPAGRYHALDALRGFAMLLGVLLHAAIPYTATRVPFWPVRDTHRSVAFDVVLLAVHDFRMQVFFLLAGFFGALLYARYGLRRTALHRLKRIAVPLALAMVTIQPALQAVGVYAVAATSPAGLAESAESATLAAAASAGEPPGRLTALYFTTGEFLNRMIPAHLWFLWYLLLCFGLMLPLAWLADRLRDRPAGRLWDAAARWLLGSRLRWFVLAGLTYPILLLMDKPAGPDTPLSWKPIWHLLGYYFLFFTVGWTLYRHCDALTKFAAGWWRSLLVANLVVFPAALFLLGRIQNPSEAGATDVQALRHSLNALLGLYTWLMIGGLVGGFLRYLAAERTWVRWLADSAYWCYLVSLPPVVAIQFVAADWEAPAGVKFLTVSAGTLATALVTYRLFVRHTWIGRLLNGSRTRPAEREVAGRPVVLAPAEVA
jgi:glucan biosynthesis protein C